MTFSESLVVAMFTLIVVFGVLAILNLIIRFFSFAICKIEDSSSKSISMSEDISRKVVSTSVPQDGEEEFSAGTIKLKNIDEPTAAMVMAIVSDESGIPLEELCFKSISLTNG